jgi:hypothetical protein
MGITLEYIIMNGDGSNMRGGTFMAITNNTSTKVTETMTTDFGDTSVIELTATLISGASDKLRIQGVNDDASNNYFIIYIARELSF